MAHNGSLCETLRCTLSGVRMLWIRLCHGTGNGDDDDMPDALTESAIFAVAQLRACSHNVHDVCLMVLRETYAHLAQVNM